MTTTTAARSRFASILKLLHESLIHPAPLILLILTVAGVFLANQAPRSYSVAVGDPEQSVFVQNFHSPIGRGAARWSGNYSYVTLSGTGGGVPLELALDVAGGEDRSGDPATLDVIVNGEQVATGLVIAPQRQTINIAVDASHQQALSARDLVVELRSTTYQTTVAPVEERGILVFGVRVEFGAGLMWPALRVVALIVVAVLLAYLIFALFGLGWIVAAAGGGVALLALLGGMLLALPQLTLLLMPLVVVLLLSYVLLMVVAAAWRPIMAFLRYEWRPLRRALVFWPLYSLLILFVLGLVAAYQVPHSYVVDLGEPGDEAYASNFHSLVEYTGVKARWTDNYAYISLPGIGGGVPLEIDLRVAGGDRPDGGPGRVMVIVNGAEVVGESDVTPGFETIRIQIDASNRQVLDQRDLVVELRAPTFVASDVAGERRGVLVDSLTVRQPGGFIVPTTRVLITLAIALLVFFIGLVRAGFRTRVAFVAAAVVAAVMVAIMALLHLPLSAAAPHLCVTAISAYVLLVLADNFLRATKPGDQLASARASLGAAAIFAGGWALRYGAAALPQAEVIDMPYHMKWLRILLGGDWQALYFPGQLSSVPPEWGLSVLIPKSPLFYFFVAPVGFLPFNLQASVEWMVTLLEAMTILFAYLLARRWLGSERGGLWAAAIYAVLPISLRSLLYGILPTIQAQWMTWLLLLLLIWRWPYITRPRVFVPLTLLFAATLIAFPTIAVFNVLLLLGLAVLWRSNRRDAALFRLAPAAPLALVGVVLTGIVVSVLAYYGQYIEPVLGTTLPAMLAQAQGQGPGGVAAGTKRWPGGPLEMVGWTLNYEVTFVPLVVGALGLVLLWPYLRGRFSGERAVSRRRFVQMLALWIAIGLLFFCANYFVDMIGKHLYYVMLPLSITAGVALLAYARRRGPSGAMAALSLLMVAWSGLQFWFGRIVP